MHGSNAAHHEDLVPFGEEINLVVLVYLDSLVVLDEAHEATTATRTWGGGGA
jgi:hypothetical protein